MILHTEGSCLCDRSLLECLFVSCLFAVCVCIPACGGTELLPASVRGNWTSASWISTTTAGLCYQAFTLLQHLSPFPNETLDIASAFKR